MALRITSALGLALLGLLLTFTDVVAAPAANNNTVLILGSTVTGGAGSREALAVSSFGFDVEIASDADWAAKTSQDFATYRAIILGDPSCNETFDPIAAALANRATWGAAVDGKVLIVGTDPVFHAPYQPGAAQMVTSAVKYILDGSQPGETHLLVTLSCYYNNRGAGNVVTLLEPFGNFVVTDNPCHQQCHIVDPGHPAMDLLTDAGISNWDCPMHANFTSWPENFRPLAIGQGFGSYVNEDGVIGQPYILTLDDGGIVEEPCEVLPTITWGDVTPDTLWSPNKKMIDIQIVGPQVGGEGVIVNRTITCSETPKAPWTVYYEDGADIWHFKLRADRNGNDVGRTYTITYEAIDQCGNVATAEAIVVVPHDMRDKNPKKK